MGRVFDERGRYLGDASSDATAADQTASDPARASFVESFGAALYEFTHPFTVQAEYEAVGKSPPPVSEIMSAAVSDMETQAAAGVTSGLSNLESAVKLLAVAGVVLGALYVYRQVTRR